MTTDAFPLRWPAHRKRTPSHQRKRAAFHTRNRLGPSSGQRALSVADSINRLQRELDLLGARLPVVSSNIELRLDGMPRSGQAEPSDQGVAVYFQLAGKPIVMACDRWDRVADNIAAIAGHIDALRKTERYGVIDMAEAFDGFAALPPPRTAIGNTKPWREVFDLQPDWPRADQTTLSPLAVIRARYRDLAQKRQDNETALRDLNVARDEAMKEFDGQ